MRIRLKLIIISFVTILVAAFVTISVLVVIVNQSFEEVEQSEMHDNLIRLEKIVSRQISKVESSTHDWAYWDDTYNFLLDLDSSFIDQEVVAEYFANSGINFITHISSEGKLIESRALNTFAEEDFDPKLANEIDAVLSELLAKNDLESDLEGIISVNNRPMMIATSVATMSDGTGDFVGLVLMGAFVDEGMVADWSDTLLYDLQFSTVANPVNQSFVTAFNQIISQPGFAIWPVNKDIISGYILFNDINEEPLFLLELNMPRTTKAIGDKTLIMTMVGMLVLIVFFIFVLFVLIGRVLTSRLEKLSKLVKKISRGERPKINIAGKDEITFLSKEIDRAVVELDKQKNQIAKYAEDLRKFKLAVEQVSEIIMITDNNFRILFVNQAGDVLLSKSKDPIGADALLTWSGNNQDIANQIKKNIAEHNILNMDVQMSDNQGYSTYELSITPVHDENDTIKFFVGVMRDVTKQREIDRMKSEFVSVASHQLKSPLSSIRWLSEALMQKKSELSKDQREYLTQIFTVNERLIRLVNDLLNISRIETGRNFTINKAQVDLVEIVKHVILDQGIVALQKKVDIILSEDSPDSVLAVVDSMKITQVLHNLLNNAIKYSPEKSIVTVTIIDRVSEVEIAVSDQGIGIPVNEHEKLFDKFFRATNVGEIEGTGLGLFIVKAFIEKHGGKIWFKSTEGKGTTFRFVLPK